MQQWFSDRGLPCLIVGSRYPGVTLPSVDIGFRAVCRHAAGLLLAKGHVRLAFLNRATGFAGDLESEHGFREATKTICQVGGEAIIGHHDDTTGGLLARLQVLIQRRPSPTGFLVSGAGHALTTMGFPMRRGLRLPQDAALISRDDYWFLKHTQPEIARYSTNLLLFAQEASRIVLQIARTGASQPLDFRVMPRLIPGETLG